MTGRAKVRAIAQGQKGGGVAVPLALPSAARIQERDWDDFLEDPTQLSNGLRDLHQAIGSDGLPVTDVETLVDQAGPGLGAGPHAQAAVEAVRRLRVSLGDSVALIAPVPGPARLAVAGMDVQTAADQVADFGKELLAAGVDVILVDDEGDPYPALSTLGNIARFHQAVVAVLQGATGQFVLAQEQHLEQPHPADGLVLLRAVPRDTDLTALEDWVEEVQSGGGATTP